MKTYLAIALVLMMAAQTSGFGLVGGMISNPATVLNAARYMTQLVMRSMAQKRTSSVPCIEHVSRSAVTFFDDASAALQLGRLLHMTMRRATSSSGSAAVPLDKFCQMVNVGRLNTASLTFVSKMTCLGDSAVDDTDRLFRSLVNTIEHVCHDGGSSATQFMADARQCRRLDAEHEEQMERVKSLRRGRRDVLSSIATTVKALSRPVTLPANTTGQTTGTTTPTKIVTTTPTPQTYSSLQACFDDVNELLPAGTQISPREVTNVFLTLPALLPRLLQRGGLLQFCPALLKGGDCAHMSLSNCPQRTQQAMARFFQSTLRGILCDSMPDDAVLSQLIWNDEVKEKYFGL